MPSIYEAKTRVALDKIFQRNRNISEVKNEINELLSSLSKAPIEAGAGIRRDLELVDISQKFADLDEFINFLNSLGNDTAIDYKFNRSGQYSAVFASELKKSLLENREFLVYASDYDRNIFLRTVTENFGFRKFIEAQLEIESRYLLKAS